MYKLHIHSDLITVTTPHGAEWVMMRPCLDDIKEAQEMVDVLNKENTQWRLGHDR